MSRWCFNVSLAVSLCAGPVAACTPTPSADASQVHASAAADVAPAAVAPAAAAAATSPAASGANAAAAYARPPKAELEARLTPLQFQVTQNAATEPPFQNEFWDNHRAGLYVDVVTGEPLFSSQDKFESGTGWPSFTRPVDDGHVATHTDSTLGMERTEVVSRGGGSHLGHVFHDGPPPTGERFCINSASLRFVPVDRLVRAGYGQYAARFGLAAPAASVVSSSNACATPPPGKAPGCKATLDVAIFAQADGDDRVAKFPGLLDVARGFEGDNPAVEVTFDPAALSYADLVATWTKGREPRSQVFARSDAQRQVANAKALRVVDAVPFRRQ